VLGPFLQPISAPVAAPGCLGPDAMALRAMDVLDKRLHPQGFQAWGGMGPIGTSKQYMGLSENRVYPQL